MYKDITTTNIHKNLYFIGVAYGREKASLCKSQPPKKLFRQIPWTEIKRKYHQLDNLANISII